jgi:glycerol-3-phosphate dehydrogenase
LVEARDFAAGTSSRSSKLFHGGLRYLEQLTWPSRCRSCTRSCAR